MSSLCYPYGPGITCVCDDGGRIYKCFPEIKSEHGSRGAGGVTGAQTQLTDAYKGPPDEHDALDRSTEIVLASTFLILVILMFLAFIVHRCEKTFIRSRTQGHHQCQNSMYQQSPSSLSSISVSIQTDPQLFSLNQSYTMPMLANGHSKTGITSLYTVTGNGTLPRGHVDLAGTKSLSRGDLELRREQNPYPQYALDNEESKSFDHLMPPNFADDETETQRMIESRSGVNPSETEDLSETDVLVPPAQQLLAKY